MTKTTQISEDIEPVQLAWRLLDIAETLELLEMSGINRKEIDVIRKAMWRIFDEYILIKKVGSNDKSNTTR